MSNQTASHLQNHGRMAEKSASESIYPTWQVSLPDRRGHDPALRNSTINSNLKASHLAAAAGKTSEIIRNEQWLFMEQLLQLAEKIESKLNIKFLVPVVTMIAVAALLTISGVIKVKNSFFP